MIEPDDDGPAFTFAKALARSHSAQAARPPTRRLMPDPSHLHTASPVICPVRPSLILVDRVATFIQRFVFLKNHALYLLLALWVIHTHLIAEFEFTPYLFVHSPERGCGKTCLLSVLDQLVFKSSGITASPTDAVLFRSAHGRTQILDEADTYLTRIDSAKGILNAGFSSQGRVQRMDKAAGGKFVLVEFPVFAARVIAGIGSQILPVPTQDRTFSIQMVRQVKGEKRERFRVRRLKSDVNEIVKSIESWAKINKEAVAARYQDPFPYLEQFQDRTMDISEPIAAVFEVAYADEPTLSSIRLEFIQSISLVRNEQMEESLDHRILGVLVQASLVKGELIGNASELAEICSRQIANCTELDVSRALRQYGFETKSVRVEGDPRKRYVLKQEALAEISRRYLGSSGEVGNPLDTTEATTS
jgi:hypothetical protein